MEQVNWENEVRKRKEAYQAGIMRHNERVDQDREDIRYTESRRLWREFIQGKITSREIEERLTKYDKQKDLELVRDIFSAKEI